MPVFETNAGGRIDISLPRTKWKELEQACDAYNKLRQEKRVTSNRLGSLRNKRETAIEQDRIALAKAIREGKADPGDKAVEKIEKEIQACHRRLEALEHALDEAESDLIDVMDEHREDWLPEAQDALDAARKQYGETVEALAAARGEVSAAWALVNWVEHFPDEEISFRVRGSYLAKLRAPHGDPYLFEQVVEALREDVEPPTPAAVIPYGAAATEMLKASRDESS